MEHKRFQLHKYQADAWRALDDPKIREIALVAGIQGGKTTFGSLAMLHWITRCKVKGANFIVAADTYKTLTQATIPTFLKIFTKRLGTYRAGDQEFVLKKGGRVFFRTSTDPDSVEGIPDCQNAWMDEAGKCSRLFKINMLGRVARLGGKVLYTSTPYSLNWLHTEVEKPAKMGDRTDIKYIQFSSADNPAFPRDEFERQRLLLDPRTFRRKYMGVHERLEGLVYELDSNNFIDSRPLGKGTRFFAGIDFGFAEGHEFALTVQAVDMDGTHYVLSEFKQAGLDPTAQVQVAMAKAKIFGIEMFYCDPARPDMIALLSKSGLRAGAFHTGKESYKPIMAGIGVIQSLIRQGKFKIFRKTCPMLEDELETYHWPEDTDGRVTREEPVKLNDHLLDAMRYCTIGAMHVFERPQKKQLVGNIIHKERDYFKPTDKVKRATTWDSY